jgi:hypothetical protein
MKKHTPFLDLYDECMASGQMMKFYGLCNAIGWSSAIFDLFTPTNQDELELSREGLSTAYWASGVMKHDPCKKRTFTPLRQTIVLFCAAINDEL